MRKKLTTLKQVTSVECYIQEFDKTISQIDSRSEDFFLCLFINGLKPHIGRQAIGNKQSNSLFGGLTSRCRPNLLLTTAKINGVDIENCALDTGASQSVISKQIISKINRSALNKIKETEKPTKVKIANGEVVNCFLTNKTQVIVGQKVTHI